MQYELIREYPSGNNYSPLEIVLMNRGIKFEDIPHYMNLTEEDNLPTSLLDNLDQAVYLICKHLNDKKGHIHVVVDKQYYCPR